MQKDLDYYQRILNVGAYLSFDTIGWPDVMPEYERLARVCVLMQKGYARQLLFSLDLCRRSFYHAFGGHGYDYVLRHFVTRLRQCGVSKAQIGTVLVGNPKRVLAIS